MMRVGNSHVDLNSNERHSVSMPTETGASFFFPFQSKQEEGRVFVRSEDSDSSNTDGLLTVDQAEDANAKLKRKGKNK